MNHKRGRAKNRRAGCLLCKPHKANGVNKEKASVDRRLQEDIEVLQTDIDKLPFYALEHIQK